VEKGLAIHDETHDCECAVEKCEKLDVPATCPIGHGCARAQSSEGSGEHADRLVPLGWWNSRVDKRVHDDDQRNDDH